MTGVQTWRMRLCKAKLPVNLARSPMALSLMQKHLNFIDVTFACGHRAHTQPKDKDQAHDQSSHPSVGGPQPKPTVSVSHADAGVRSIASLRYRERLEISAADKIHNAVVHSLLIE